MTPVVDVCVAAARDLARLAVPVECPGCGARDEKWCDECAALWWEPPVRVESLAPRLDVEGRPSLPVWSVATLAGPAHGFLTAWKDAGRRDLDTFLGAAMRRQSRAVAPALASVPGRVLTVAVPARPGAVRRRGRDLPEALADAAAQGLAGAGRHAAHAAGVLRLARGEQRGGSARRRWQAMSGALRARRALPGEAVLLVDDVMTTGASLAVASDALERAGAAVFGALVLAVAEPARAGAVTGLG